jgi:hypothetical protein
LQTGFRLVPGLMIVQLSTTFIGVAARLRTGIYALH